MLASVPVSNEVMVDAAVQAVRATEAKRVAVVGLAFKPGTDDLRESPAVELIAQMLREGVEVSIFDANVKPGKAIGANLAYIQERLPHYETLLAPDMPSALDGAEVIVVTHASEDLRSHLDDLVDCPRIIDLVGLFKGRPSGDSYIGLSW